MTPNNIIRKLPKPDMSFFLFGPRGVGKSTWLEQNLKDAYAINLMKHADLLAFTRNPSLLENKTKHLPVGSWVYVDEVQKLPALLDEVHRLIKERKLKFALTGSSARKLKRGGANLLAGRAITRNLSGFSWAELGEHYDLAAALEWGMLPDVVLNAQYRHDILSAYVFTYLKEEIKEEGLVRNAEPFVRFLEVAGMMHGQQLNAQNVASEAQVARSTIDTYLSILEDTLMATLLKPYQPRAKLREQTHPKLYWFDAGVARSAAGLLGQPPESVWLGYSLETLVLHEMRAYQQIQNKVRPIHYYRTQQDQEIDFVIETQKAAFGKKAKLVCLEVKHSNKWRSEFEKAIRNLAASDKVQVEKMTGVYLGDERLTFGEFEVYPVLDFFAALHAGEFF